MSIATTQTLNSTVNQNPSSTTTSVDVVGRRAYTDIAGLQALKAAGISDPSKCYFVDDSLSNVKAARALGWGSCIHFCERGLLHVEGGKPKYIGSDIKEQPDEDGIGVIAKIDELRGVRPEIFKQ